MKYRFAEMIWYEIREAAEQDRVAVLPVATYEDHGPHLPVDTDVVLCTEICERAVARIPSEAVLAPPVPHGYSPHHMDFHGTLTITWDTFIRYVKDVCCSLAHHGFKRILVVNGHGSNTPPLDLATRLTVIEYRGQGSVRLGEPLGAPEGERGGTRTEGVGLRRDLPRRRVRDVAIPGIETGPGRYEQGGRRTVAPVEQLPVRPARGRPSRRVQREFHAVLEHENRQRRDGRRDEGQPGEGGAIPRGGHRGADRTGSGTQGDRNHGPPRPARIDEGSNP